MSFGVPCGMHSDAARTEQDRETLLAVAREAAEHLVAHLEHARRLTRGWTDASLSDALVDAALSACLHRLAGTGCWGEANRPASNEFWRIAGSALQPGALQCRARVKPRGYAGDYVMLRWIGAGYCCDHPLGQVFDRYFQRQAAPEAVRCRTRQVAAALAAHCLRSESAESYRVVSVGAGPADDIHQALALLSEDRRRALRVGLLDLDPEALEFGRQQIAPLVQSAALECIRENLYRLPQKAVADGILRSPDFLVCSGLFDYLDDSAAVAMLRLFWERLAAGGLLLVGNFAPHNPTRAYMEWIGNWYLTYRSAGDLERLAVEGGIPRERFSIGSEALGVDLFVIAQK